MKFNTSIKSIILIFLLCMFTFVETSHKTNIAKKKFSKKNKSNSENYTNNLSTAHSITNYQKAEKTSSKHRNNRNLIKEKTSRKYMSFKKLMMTRAKAKLFQFVKDIFRNIKDRIASLVDNTDRTLKDTAELKILQIIWDQIMKQVKNVDDIVNKISFYVNNPITGILLKIKELTFDQYYAYEKPHPKPKNPQEEEENRRIEAQRKARDEQEAQNTWIQRGEDKLIRIVKSAGKDLVIGSIENFISSNIEDVYAGFFKGMLVELSPIAMINSQDSQNLQKVENYIIQNTSGEIRTQQHADMAHTLQADVNAFIDQTVNTCKADSNIKANSREIFNKIIFILRTHFDTFDHYITKFNNLVREDGVDRKQKEIEFEKEVAENDRSNTTILQKIITISEAVWNILGEQLQLFLNSVSQCFETYKENFVRFLPRVFGGVVVSTVGGILDGFVKSIPLVSQGIGMVNWLIGIYNTWRIYSFGAIIVKKPADSTQLNASSLGVKLSKFVCSKLRAIFGLTNLPGVENALKVGYGVYLVVMSLLSDKPESIKIEKKTDDELFDSLNTIPEEGTANMVPQSSPIRGGGMSSRNKKRHH